MNQMTFQAIGWFLGSAVLLVVAALLVSAHKQMPDDEDKFTIQALAFVAVFFVLLFFGIGWASLSVVLFGGGK